MAKILLSINTENAHTRRPTLNTGSRYDRLKGILIETAGAHSPWPQEE
jgi:hypothetical protein